jgi:hypothetical protein
MDHRNNVFDWGLVLYAFLFCLLFIFGFSFNQFGPIARLNQDACYSAGPNQRVGSYGRNSCERKQRHPPTAMVDLGK